MDGIIRVEHGDADCCCRHTHSHTALTIQSDLTHARYCNDPCTSFDAVFRRFGQCIDLHCVSKNKTLDFFII